MNSSSSEQWLTRLPRAGETCVFSSEGQDARRESQGRLVNEWKRDALLFDRVYARCLDPDDPPDIPLEVSFGDAEVERKASVKWEENKNSTAWMISQAYAGMSEKQIQEHMQTEYGNSDTWDYLLDTIDQEILLTETYSSVGVMGQWTYSSNRLYLRRFSKGEQIAYEGALNNLPLVATDRTPWEQIIAFRADSEAARKYRDLRLWLRTGLGAESVEHATDIIAQKIEDYRWAIKKHGLDSTLGAFTQLFDWKESRTTLAAAGTAGFFGGPVWASIASGMTIAAKIGVWLCEKKLAAASIGRGPDREIAILYEAQERFAERAKGVMS